MRWRKANGEMASPEVFIPAAEKGELIGQITALVIGQIARDAKGLFNDFPEIHLGINLAAADLHAEQTTQLLKQLLNQTQTKPGNILVEATERGFMNTDEARSRIHDIRLLGIGVAIDDFGTGYSSLAYLESFELDYLKIDKSFVDKIGTQAATSQVIYHIIDMAKDLKLKMIAEGVETEAQAQILRDQGVEFVQGWLYSKALNFQQLKQGLKQQRQSSARAALEHKPESIS